MVDQTSHFIEKLFNAFRDNALMNHYAEYDGARIYSTMPATSFIYNFFIYNTIYQYDWETSLKQKIPTPWNAEREPQVDGDPGEMSKPDSEFARQKKLEKFLRKRCRQDDTILHRALLPISRLSDLEGRWISLFVSTSRAHRESVGSFFKHLSDLSRAIQSAGTTGDGKFSATKQNFEMIQKCRFFVYSLRNEIITGSKTLGDFVDINHEKRLAHYDLFIKCLLQLFFLCMQTGQLSDYCFNLNVRSGGALPPPSASQVRFKSFVNDH